MSTERTIKRLENIHSELTIALENARNNNDIQESSQIEIDIQELLEEKDNLKQKISGSMD